MVSDQEPRYRLVDSGGTVVGTLFAEADGTLKLQEGTSGSDNELAFGTDGALSVEVLESDNTVFLNSNSGSYSHYTDDLVTVAANSEQTIFDISGEVDILYGEIVGPQIAYVTVTFGDGSTADLYETRMLGRDDAGDILSSRHLPPARSVSKLVFGSEKDADAEFGWGVVTI